VGDILGAGIYGLVGKAAGQMGNAVWLAFVISVIAAGLTGLTYASLGSRYPKAAGASYITGRAFRKNWLAYGVGLAVLSSGLVSMATATRIFSGYFQGLVGEGIPFTLIMIGFALTLAGIVFWGIRESMWVNAVCTLIELSGLVIIIVFGVSFIGSVDYFDATSATNLTGEIGPSILLSGAVLTFYSFVGFEDILNVSEEIKDPEKTLPLGLLIAVAITSVMYVVISLVAVSVIPAGELSQSQEPLVDVVRKIAPWFPPSVYSVIAMFAVANTALLNFIMGSRLIYGMAQQNLLPKFLSRVHSARKTPHVAVFAVFAILLVLALSGDVSTLAKATSVLLLSCFMLMNVSLIILKRRKSEPPGKFEIPLIIPILGAITCAFMLFHAQAPELTIAGVILAVIGVLYFFIGLQR
jgi:amino acid transporter